MTGKYCISMHVVLTPFQVRNCFHCKMQSVELEDKPVLHLLAGLREFRLVSDS